MDQVAEGVTDPTTLTLEFALLWTQEDLAEMRAAARRGFSRLAEPMGGLLTILEGCSLCKKPAELKLEILLSFHKWQRVHPQVSLDALPEDQAMALRRRALGLVTDRMPAIVNKMASLYQLDRLDGATLRQHVAWLKAQHLHCEAATFSIKMEVQQLLDVEDMCTPLLLQDKVTLAEHYVSGHADLEQRLATLLDSWCDPRFCPDTVVRRYPDEVQKQFHLDQMKPKILSKHVFRLVGKFNIDPSLCQHSVHLRKKGTIRFLMEKRFYRRDMDEEDWRDHTRAIIADDPEMQKYVDELLPSYCSKMSAVKSSQQLRNPPKPRTSLQDADWDRSDSYYQLPIPRSHVHFLGSVEDLEGAWEVLCKEGGTVGLDMEWCAGFGCTAPERVSLIQLAVADRVFILDMCAVDLWQHPRTLEVMRSLLSDPKVLKLGYGLAGDLKNLQSTWSLSEPLKTARVLDLITVHKELKRGPVKRWSVKGLSQLVLLVLGRPLDKKEQLSYWQRRPLHPNQLRYAASDAFCLLEVHAELSRDSPRYGLTAQQLAV